VGGQGTRSRDTEKERKRESSPLPLSTQASREFDLGIKTDPNLRLYFAKLQFPALGLPIVPRTHFRTHRTRRWAPTNPAATAAALSRGLREQVSSRQGSVVKAFGTSGTRHRVDRAQSGHSDGLKYRRIWGEIFFIVASKSPTLPFKVCFFFFFKFPSLKKSWYIRLFWKMKEETILLFS